MSNRPSTQRAVLQRLEHGPATRAELREHLGSLTRPRTEAQSRRLALDLGHALKAITANGRAARDEGLYRLTDRRMPL